MSQLHSPKMCIYLFLKGTQSPREHQDFQNQDQDQISSSKPSTCPVDSITPISFAQVVECFFKHIKHFVTFFQKHCINKIYYYGSLNKYVLPLISTFLLDMMRKQFPISCVTFSVAKVYLKILSQDLECIIDRDSTGGSYR